MTSAALDQPVAASGGYAPVAGQQAPFLFYADDATYIVLIGARGGGKSMTLAQLAAQLAANNPGLRVAIVSIDLRRLRDGIIPHLRSFLPPRFYRRWDERNNEVQLKNGSSIFFRSQANTPEDVRGVNAHVSILDEARLVHYETFKNLDFGTRGPYERDHLVLYNGDDEVHIPYKRRVYLASSTFVGSWIYHEWERQDPAWAWFEVTADDLVRAEIRTQEEIDQRRAQYGDAVAAQELDCKWVRLEGVVIDRFDAGVHVRRRPDRGAFTRVVGGVDFAEAGGVTAIEVVGWMGTERAWVIDERTFEGTDQNRPEFWRDALMHLTSMYGVSRWYCDWAQRKLIEHLRDYGIYGLEDANKDKMLRINTFNSMLQKRTDGEPGLYIDPDCERLLWELPRWLWNTRGQELAHWTQLHGKWETNNGPKDGWDAASFALVGAGAVKRGGVRVVPVRFL